MGFVCSRQFLDKSLIFLRAIWFCRWVQNLRKFKLEKNLAKNPLTRCFIIWCFICFNFAVTILLDNLQSMSSSSMTIFPYSFLAFFTIFASVGSKNLTVKPLPTFFVKIVCPGRWWMMITDLSFQLVRSFQEKADFYLEKCFQSEKGIWILTDSEGH